MAVALVLVSGAPAALAAESEAAKSGIPDPSIATSLPHNGDAAGLRRWLFDRGVQFTINYTNDVLSNVSGGARRGMVDQGLLEPRLTVDMEKLAGWRGLTLFANMFQIDHTGRIRRDDVGGVNTIAAIEGVATTRLSELWAEQKFFGDKASLRFGQLAADVEFFFSDTSSLFLQSDWPTIAAAALPSGGPAYPLATPGVRLKLEPNQYVAMLFAVFNGDPAGPGLGDEQVRNRHGLNFRVRDPAFTIGELQLRNKGKDDPGVSTTLKIGGWTHFGPFDDRRFADDGTVLADPNGSGVALRHRGNFGLYGILDQQIYRPPGAAADKGVFVFTRASLSPSDRNPFNVYVDGGVVFAGLVPGRPDDRFGVSVIYARYSDAVRAFDQDQIAFAGPGRVRDFEANLELTYSAQVIPGWTIQPDFQYVWHPSGQTTPDGQALRDAKVIGVRSKWTF